VSQILKLNSQPAKKSDNQIDWRMEKEEKTGERGDLCAVNNAAMLQNMSLL